MAIVPAHTQGATSAASIGLQFIRSVINSGSRQAVAQANQAWFVEGELPAWTAFMRHYRQHGALPSVQTMAELGYRLPLAGEPPAYYSARLSARGVYNAISQAQPELAEAMRVRNTDAVTEVVRRMHHATASMAVTQDTSTLLAEFANVMEDYAVAAASPGVQGITLGWPELDEITGGLEPGDVGVMAGRPGMGKSYLICHAALQAWLSDHPIVLVTNEMTARQIARRILAMYSGVNPSNLRRGQLSRWAQDVVVQRMNEARNAPPFYLISGDFKKSVPAVDAAIQEFNPDIVYIDASYLMRPSDAGQGGRKQWELLSAVGREIKDMAQSRSVPILHTVQFNRDASKTRGRQGVEMIGGTDEVGQIATVAVGISQGDAAHETTRRRLTLMKVRESEGANNPLTINYLFDPPDFSVVPADDQGNPLPAAIGNGGDIGGPDDDEWER